MNDHSLEYPSIPDKIMTDPIKGFSEWTLVRVSELIEGGYL